jgi:hypothetical protein
MTEPTELGTFLERLSPPLHVERDWDDVLRRSSRRRPTSRRFAGVAAVALAAVLVPTLAVAGIRLAFAPPHSLQVGATIDDAASGLHATFTAAPRHSFTAVASGRTFATRQIEWTLVLDGPRGAVVNAELAVRDIRVPLCERCASHEEHSVVGSGGVWLQLLGGHGRLRVTVNGQPLAAILRRPSGR